MEIIVRQSIFNVDRARSCILNDINYTNEISTINCKNIVTRMKKYYISQIKLKYLKEMRY